MRPVSFDQLWSSVFVPERRTKKTHFVSPSARHLLAGFTHHPNSIHNRLFLVKKNQRDVRWIALWNSTFVDNSTKHWRPLWLLGSAERWNYCRRSSLLQFPHLEWTLWISCNVKPLVNNSMRNDCLSFQLLSSCSLGPDLYFINKRKNSFKIGFESKTKFKLSKALGRH